MNMHSKYDSLHKNYMNYTLKWYNNNVITSKYFMLSYGRDEHIQKIALSTNQCFSPWFMN